MWGWGDEARRFANEAAGLFAISTLLINGQLTGELKPKPLNFCKFLSEMFRLEELSPYNPIFSNSHHPLAECIFDPDVIRFALHHRVRSKRKPLSFPSARAESSPNAKIRQSKIF